MKVIVALLLASSLAFADPADAPKVPLLTPREAAECLTCAGDLRDEKASSAKWIAVGVAVSAVVFFGIGFGAGFAVKK